MSVRLNPLILVAILGSATLPCAAEAAAAPCPDVEVVYARGTETTPPVDPVGQAFITALSAKLPGRSVAVYGVNYPASLDLAGSAAKGAADAWVHVVNQAAACPTTKMVLSGYSQGAGVMDLIISEKALPWAANTPMPSSVEGHIAAIAVFGNPLRRLAGIGLTSMSKTYAARTIDLCASGDPICSTGSDLTAHGKYGDLIAQAATFTATRVT